MTTPTPGDRLSDDGRGGAAHLTSKVVAIGSALALSLCCVGPVVLLALGLSGVYVIEAIKPYRPAIIAVELAAFAAYKYTQPCQSEGCGEAVCRGGETRSSFSQMAFWLALAGAVAVLVGFALG